MDRLALLRLASICFFDAMVVLLFLLNDSRGRCRVWPCAAPCGAGARIHIRASVEALANLRLGWGGFWKAAPGSSMRLGGGAGGGGLG